MKKIIRLLTVTAVVCVLVMSFVLPASAASAKMKGVYDEDDGVVFTLTVSDSKGVGGFQGDFTITGGTIKKVSGGSISSINGSRFMFALSNAKESATMTIFCKPTDSKVTLSADVSKVIDDDAKELDRPIGLCSASVTVPASSVSDPDNDPEEDTTNQGGKSDSTTKDTTKKGQTSGSTASNDDSSESDDDVYVAPELDQEIKDSNGGNSGAPADDGKSDGSGSSDPGDTTTIGATAENGSSKSNSKTLTFVAVAVVAVLAIVALVLLLTRKNSAKTPKEKPAEPALSEESKPASGEKKE